MEQKAIAAEMKDGENKQYLSVLGCFRSIVRVPLLFNHSARTAYQGPHFVNLKGTGEEY